jgi:catechol 2,3-dioxygenase-like lactoylglutathione lyase family enzyme
MFKAAVPVLHVGSSVAAEDFYCKGLGFTVEFRYRPDQSADDPCYLGLVRDGAVVHLSTFSGDGVVGSAVYVIVDDVDALHAEFVSKGVPIDTPPVDQTWGMREMFVRDPDGNRIQFGHVLPRTSAG